MTGGGGGGAGGMRASENLQICVNSSWASKEIFPRSGQKIVNRGAEGKDPKKDKRNQKFIKDALKIQNFEIKKVKSLAPLQTPFRLTSLLNGLLWQFPPIIKLLRCLIQESSLKTLSPNCSNSKLKAKQQSENR